MTAPVATPGVPTLASLGIRYAGTVYENLSAPALVEHALRRHEGKLTDTGALNATTGTHTGRTPKDRYLVEEPSSRDQIDWGSVNRPMTPAVFDRLYDRVRAYLQGRDLFVADAL